MRVGTDVVRVRVRVRVRTAVRRRHLRASTARSLMLSLSARLPTLLSPTSGPSFLTLFMNLLHIQWPAQDVDEDGKVWGPALRALDLLTLLDLLERLDAATASTCPSNQTGSHTRNVGSSG